VWLALIPEAVTAFTAFDAAQLYGPFSQSSLRKSFNAAAKKVTTEKVWPYRLRHSFATEAFRALGNLQAVRDLMGHRSDKTTFRYAASAERDVLDASMASVARHFGPTDQRHPKKVQAKISLTREAATEPAQRKSKRKAQKSRE